jgi:hypothetical protein
MDWSKNDGYHVRLLEECTGMTRPKFEELALTAKTRIDLLLRIERNTSRGRPWTRDHGTWTQ